jgi:homoserine O-acetyltransferase/O-succinyltransferase
MTDSYSRSGARRRQKPGAHLRRRLCARRALPLECGRTLACPTLHYAVYGRLNAARDNAVLVCHALSGSALVGSWWPEIFAPGAVLSLEHDFVICINMLGSCYGSTGPGSVNPETGEIYGPDFPLVGIRDNVRAQARLLDSLGIRRLRLVLGGSIGGMQALEWAILHPERVERALIIGVRRSPPWGWRSTTCSARPFSTIRSGRAGAICRSAPPRRGLALARQIAMISYKSAPALRRALRPQSQPQRRRSLGAEDRAAASSAAVRHRRLPRSPGKALHRPLRRQRLPGHPARHGHLGSAARFLPRRRGLRPHRARLSFVGISSDWLFPPDVGAPLCRIHPRRRRQADYREMTSDHGHDAFLAEQAELVRLLQ